MNRGQIWLENWAIMNNVNFEHELYEPMCDWLRVYMRDKHRRDKCKIEVVDCHSEYLDVVLNRYGIIQYFPQVVGLQIEIDVLGMAIWNNKAELIFIEAKKTPLNLQNLGQLLIYCKLCDPEEAFLLSSGGVGSLTKVLVNLTREDLLNYGLGRKIKKIRVARWDIIRNSIDHHSIIPKI